MITVSEAASECDLHKLLHIVPFFDQRYVGCNAAKSKYLATVPQSAIIGRGAVAANVVY